MALSFISASPVLKGSAAAAAKSLQPCLTLCDPIDSSPPGSSVRGIFQARVLEWVAIVFSVIRVLEYSKVDFSLISYQ